MEQHVPKALNIVNLPLHNQQFETVRRNQNEKKEWKKTSKGKSNVCLKDWWFKWTELKECPHGSVTELRELKLSTLLKYLYKAELFRETYGDSLVPLLERSKRRKYEIAAGLLEHDYESMYDRKTVHDPDKTTRYNKKRRIVEQFEDYKNTWICKHDEKPCGCSKCLREPRSDIGLTKSSI